jgi:hypothetical protein
VSAGEIRTSAGILRPGSRGVHASVLGLCLLTLAAGFALDAGPAAASAGGVELPSVCPLRHTSLGGCPGCGLTRSVIALCHLRLRDSLAFHPGGILVVAAILLEIPFRLASLGVGAASLRIPPPGRWPWVGVLVVGVVRWSATLFT